MTEQIFTTVIYITVLCTILYLVVITGAVPAMKPEATAIGDPQDGRCKITLMFDGRRFCIPKFRYSTLQQTTCQWSHWWFPTTSCFGVTNHGRLASLWLVRQDRATINSGSLPSCGTLFWQWSRWVGWLVRYLDIYLFYMSMVVTGHRWQLTLQCT